MTEPTKYAPAVAELLDQLPLAPLGPGRPAEAMRDKLAALSDESFGPRVADRRLAAACRAGAVAGVRLPRRATPCGGRSHTAHHRATGLNRLRRAVWLRVVRCGCLVLSNLLRRYCRFHCGREVFVGHLQVVLRGDGDGVPHPP